MIMSLKGCICLIVWHAASPFAVHSVCSVDDACISSVKEEQKFFYTAAHYELYAEMQEINELALSCLKEEIEYPPPDNKTFRGHLGITAINGLHYVYLLDSILGLSPNTLSGIDNIEVAAVR